MTYQQTLGLRLQTVRVARNLSHKQLAGLLEIDPQRVYRWESGYTPPSCEMLCRIADHLGVDAGYLVRANNTSHAEAKRELAR